MPFKKGKSGNPNGKPAGTKSQKTLQWEALGTMMVEDCTEKVMQYLNDLWRKDKEAYFKAYTQLLEYFKPKLGRTEHTGKDGTELQTTTIIQVMESDHAKRLSEIEERLKAREG